MTSVSEGTTSGEGGNARHPGDLPRFIADLLNAKKCTPRKATSEIIDWERAEAEAVDIIKRRLETEGEPVEGQGSDDATYRLACRLRDVLPDQDKVTDLLMEHWCPRFEREWVEEHPVASAWRYGQNEAGADAPIPDAIAWAGVVPPEGAPANQKDTNLKPIPAWRSFDELLALPDKPKNWLWDEVWLSGKTNLITGAPGVGKTTLAENAAIAICGGIPLFGRATKRQHVFLLVAEDDEERVRENLLAIARDLSVGHDMLRPYLHVLSVESNPIEDEDGHLLAKIDEHGDAIPTRFLRERIFPALLDRGEPATLMVDPNAEFVTFNRINPLAARAVARKVYRPLTCDGRVTVLVFEHPTYASMERGNYTPGDMQFAAAFATAHTLLAQPWQGSPPVQRAMTLKGLKARYAAEQDLAFYRLASTPAYSSAPMVGMAPRDHMLKVLKHIVGRIRDDKICGRTDSSQHGPNEMANALGMSKGDVTTAIKQMIADRWLIWEAAKGGGGKDSGRGIGHFETGPNFPGIDAEENTNVVQGPW
jgi:KaiC/GvpD/RAD55 family RecA-like ATPase